jgi:hypothetical protein
MVDIGDDGKKRVVIFTHSCSLVETMAQVETMGQVEEMGLCYTPHYVFFSSALLSRQWVSCT